MKAQTHNTLAHTSEISKSDQMYAYLKAGGRISPLMAVLRFGVTNPSEAIRRARKKHEVAVLKTPITMREAVEDLAEMGIRITPRFDLLSRTHAWSLDE